MNWEKERWGRGWGRGQRVGVGVGYKGKAKKVDLRESHISTTTTVIQAGRAGLSGNSKKKKPLFSGFRAACQVGHNIQTTKRAVGGALGWAFERQYGRLKGRLQAWRFERTEIFIEPQIFRLPEPKPSYPRWTGEQRGLPVEPEKIQASGKSAA
ncbi:hypothetical protein L484_019765 [Morus notabilis]|uniref:Uncharacterized protein n=1 Tax=Morus notabilis TaxID=981085 RepID=W9RDN9_9ROSA|nr:hypothetical protein L484_019765 [Morus notabilis]